MTDVLHREFNVLDFGSVTLIDCMGDDRRIDDAARISYLSRADQEPRSDEQVARLIRYLMRHGHTSPFEQVVFVFHLKLPIFVQRQLIRHRTARVNEISARYCELPEEAFVPDVSRVCAQSKSNKQASSAPLTAEQQERAVRDIEASNMAASYAYRGLLDAGVSREIARTVLPVGTYTEMVWQMDLSNLLRFIELRLDEHAQPEIREYAKVFAWIVRSVCPATFAAWEELVWGAVKVCPSDDHNMAAIVARRRPLIVFDNSIFSDS